MEGTDGKGGSGGSREHQLLPEDVVFAKGDGEENTEKGGADCQSNQPVEQNMLAD